MLREISPMEVRPILASSFSILKQNVLGFIWVNILTILPLLGLLLLGVLIFHEHFVFYSCFTEDFTFALVGPAGVTPIGALVLLFVTLRVLSNHTYGLVNLCQVRLHGGNIGGYYAYQGVQGKRWLFVRAYLISIIFLLIFVAGYMFLIGDNINIYTHPVQTILVHVGSFLLFYLFCLTPVILTMEKRGAISSLIRSVTLPAGNRLRMLLITAVSYLIIYGISCLLRTLGNKLFVLVGQTSIIGGIITGLFFLLVNFIVWSTIYAPLTVIYFDLLSRNKEYEQSVAI